MENGKVELREEPVAKSGGRPHQNEDLLSEIVRYWWAKRWFIVKTMTIALAVFIPLLLLVPKRYRAEATIMIVPPRFMPEQRPEPLSVGTARSLLASGELQQQMIVRIRQAKSVVDSLLAEHAVPAAPSTTFFSELSAMEADEAVARYGKVLQQVTGGSDEATSALALYLTRLSPAETQALSDMKSDELAEMTVQDLSEALESEDIIEKKTANDVRFSPLLRLFAVADDGAKAQLYANTWARLFEKMYEALTVDKTFSQYSSIRKQQEETQQRLEEIQKATVEFKTNNNLELYQKQIDEYSQDFREFSRQLTLKQSAYLAEQGRLGELQRLAESVEHEETWVGRVDVALRKAEALLTPPALQGMESSDDSASTLTLNLNVTPEQLSAAVADEEPTKVERAASEVYGKIRNQAVQSRDRLAAAILELNEFYRDQPLQLMEKERDQLQKDYLDSISRLRTGQVRLAVLRRSVVDLDERLSGTQRLLSLNTGVPTETIASLAGQGGNLQRLTRLEFLREELNPEWMTLAEGKAELVQEMEILASEVAALEVDLPKNETLLRDLQERIYRVQLSEQFMKENMDRWQRTNQELFDMYVETNNSIAGTARGLQLLGIEVSNLEESTSRTKAYVERYQNLYNQAASELVLLESRQRAASRQAEVLLQKLQDAQIAVSGEVSDVSVAALAVTPSRHFFPRRSVFTILFTFFAGAVVLGALARSRYLELRQRLV